MASKSFDRRAMLKGSLAAGAGLALAAYGSGKADAGVTKTTGGAASGSAGASDRVAPINPFLASSITSIGHNDSAQTSSVLVKGPLGPSTTLTEAELQYQFLGPGHFGMATSAPYPDGSRVIWSNGGDRVSKVDYETLEVLAELPLPGVVQVTAAEAEAAIAELDGQSGYELAQTGLALAAKYLHLSGTYFALDKTNTLFVAETAGVAAYHDAKPGNRKSPIVQRGMFALPGGVTGNVVGLNMTYDGKIVAVTNEGWVMVIDRDFGRCITLAIPGSDQAAAHNEEVESTGKNISAGSWVRKSISVDHNGGIYIASPGMMHKVVWTGTRLSSDAADGAWDEPYLDAAGLGAGSTPSLMGFGDTRFVITTDGQPVMNIVMYWRDKIPADWKQLPGAPSRRIAGMVPVDLGDPTTVKTVTQNAVSISEWGAFVVNNVPASVPANFPVVGLQALTAFSGADPLYAPHGVQKFEWNPKTRNLASAWSNIEVGDPNSTPIISTPADTVYFVGARDGRWTVEGLNWTTGHSRFTWKTDSNRYNASFAGTEMDQQGRIIYTTEFGIVRYPH
jgi:hypothetical protein